MHGGKLAEASYNNSDELLNQNLEILQVCGHKKSWLLVDKLQFNLIVFIYYVFMLILFFLTVF